MYLAPNLMVFWLVRGVGGSCRGLGGTCGHVRGFPLIMMAHVSALIPAAKDAGVNNTRKNCCCCCCSCCYVHCQYNYCGWFACKCCAACCTCHSCKAYCCCSKMRDNRQ